MLKFLIIAGGGAVGALLRYIVSGIAYKYSYVFFPFGTLAVNLIGSFSIGFLWEISERIFIAPDIRLFLFIGVIGAFTTFSTYGLETFNLFRDGEIKFAILNILISNILGIALVFIGFITSKFLFNIIH